MLYELTLTSQVYLLVRYDVAVAFKTQWIKERSFDFLNSPQQFDLYSKSVLIPFDPHKPQSTITRFGALFSGFLNTILCLLTANEID